MIRSGGGGCRSVSNTFWWTNFRTPTSRNWNSCTCFRREEETSWSWATTIRLFIASVGRLLGASSCSCNDSRRGLRENYRSTPNILRVATQAIGMNEVSPEFPKKVLQPNKSEGEKIRIVEMESPEDEAAWVADELERLHGAGRRWREFAVLYRQHAHRDQLVEQLSQRKIPFVISRLSILEHPLVRDVLAYLRLIAKPFDDIACARVLSAPAWYLTAEELVRLAERAGKKRGTALYDVVQAPQATLPFDPLPNSTGPLLEFLGAQRKTMRRRTAREILGDLVEWLEVPQRANKQARKYVNQLAQFLKDWEPKSETRSLPEFLEYLDYYEQAGGVLCLEDGTPGDAVQLM